MGSFGHNGAAPTSEPQSRQHFWRDSVPCCRQRGALGRGGNDAGYIWQRRQYKSAE